MTLEEAIEVILAGDPFTDCSTCMGAGYYPSTQLDGDGNRLPQICDPCRMTGKILRPEYAKACEVLGRPLPKYKPKYHGHRDIPSTGGRPQGPITGSLQTVIKAMQATGILGKRSKTPKAR